MKPFFISTPIYYVNLFTIRGRGDRVARFFQDAPCGIHAHRVILGQAVQAAARRSKELAE